MAFNRLKKQGYDKTVVHDDDDDDNHVDIHGHHGDDADMYDPETMRRIPNFSDSNGEGRRQQQQHHDAEEEEEEGGDAQGRAVLRIRSPAAAAAAASSSFKSPSSCNPETEVLDHTLDSKLDGEGIDIASMRKGGLRPQDRRRRCRALALASLSIVVLGGIAWGIVAALEYKKNESFGKNNGKGVGKNDNSTPLPQPPPPPPKDLSRRCSPLAVSSQAGWDACESTCAAAECCFLDDGHWYSCISDYPEDCSAYRYSCQTLDHVQELKDKTKMEYGIDPSGGDKVGPGNGGDGNGNGNGVSTSVTTTQSSNQTQKQSSPPQITIPTAPTDLAEVCGTLSLGTSIGFIQCQFECEQASCCDGWDSNVAISGGRCAPLNPENCVQYERPCSILSGTPASHPGAIASQIQVKCNTAHLETPEGHEECVELCEYGACCFYGMDPSIVQDGGTNGGANQQQQQQQQEKALALPGTGCVSNETAAWCEQYGPCQMIYQLPPPLPTTATTTPDGDGGGGNEAGQNAAITVSAKKAVDDACSAGFTECKNICSPAGCCFPRPGLDEGKSCQDVGLDDLRCEDYASCETLFVTDITGDYDNGIMLVQLASAPANLDSLCSSPRPDDVTTCTNACHPAHCCMEEITICKVLDPQSCSDYYGPCKDAWSRMPNEVLVPPPPEDIADQCLNGVGTPQTSSDCQNACRGGECCIEPIEVCTVRNPDACRAYHMFCDAIWSDPDELLHLGPVPAYVSDHCGGSAMATDASVTTLSSTSTSSGCIGACRESVCCNGIVPCGRLVVQTAQCDEYRDAGCQGAWERIESEYASQGVTARGPDVTQLDGGGGLEKVHIPEEAPPSLSTLCSEVPNSFGAVSDPVRWEQCKNACGVAYCCSPGNNDECEPLNPPACLAYHDLCQYAWSERSKEITIPLLPNDIDDYCSSGTGQTMSDKKKCTEACNNAKCCLDPKAGGCGPISNHGICEMYKNHCHLLWDSTEMISILPPPTNLDQLCSQLSLSTTKGEMACKDACIHGDCCTDSAGCDSKSFTNLDMCRRYSPCLNLIKKEEGEKLPVAVVVTVSDPPSYLGQICSIESLATAAGHGHCASICDRAKCCYMPIEECPVSNPSVCSSYEPCQVLHTKDANKYSGFVEIPPAPDDINDACSAESLLTVQGFTRCEDLCDRARCCLDDAEECNVKNPAECAGYDICSSIYEKGGAFDDQDQETLMKLTEDVARACNPADLLNPQGLSACQHICNDRLCCFEKDPDYSCVEKKECVVFAPCETLVDYGYNDASDSNPSNDATQSATDPHVNNICSSDALKTVAGFNACWEICSPFLCCFADDERENCYGDQENVCNTYSSCAAIVSPSGGGSSVGNDDAKSSAITRDVVSEACSQANLKSEQGLQTCATICGPRMCCFVKLGQQSNCVDSLGKECLTFAACSVLADIEDDVVTLSEGNGNGGVIQNPAIADIAANCDPRMFNDPNSEEAMLRCVDLCSHRACCFSDGPGNCYQTDKEWCDEYGPCEIVKSYKDNEGYGAPATVDFQGGIDDGSSNLGGPDMKSEIEALCDPQHLASSVALSSCHTACDDQQCCWDQNQKCYDEKSSECAMFGGCKSLYIFLVEQEENTPDKLCTEEAMSSPERRDACQNKCNERGCCWVESSSGNCYEQFASWCDEYKQCQILDSPIDKQTQGADLSVDGDDDHPNIVCTSDKISTILGKDKCEAKCNERACCWKGLSAGNCYEEKESWCDEYKQCLIVYSPTVTAAQGGSSSAVGDDDHPDAVCAPDKVTTILGRDKCEAKCGERACCWKGLSTGNCYEDKASWCDEYKQCLIIHSPIVKAGQGGNSTADGDDDDHPNTLCVVDKVATETGRDKCQNKCDERGCCWAGNCASIRPEWCEEYEACNILREKGSSNEVANDGKQNVVNTDPKEGSDMEPVTLNSELAKICSDSGMKKDNGEACQRLCKPQSCCFAADEIYGCKDEQPVLCNEFKACEILFKDLENQSKSKNTEEVTLASELSNLCSEAGIKEDNGEACQRICKPQSCCFASDTRFNCRKEQTNICEEFDLCATLYTGEMGDLKVNQDVSNSSASPSGVAPKTEVDDACNKFYSTQKEKCLVLCEDAQCCFTDDPTQSCQGMKLFCSEYAPCKRVYQEA